MLAILALVIPPWAFWRSDERTFYWTVTWRVVLMAELAAIAGGVAIALLLLPTKPESPNGT